MYCPRTSTACAVLGLLRPSPISLVHKARVLLVRSGPVLVGLPLGADLLGAHLKVGSNAVSVGKPMLLCLSFQKADVRHWRHPRPAPAPRRGRSAAAIANAVKHRVNLTCCYCGLRYPVFNLRDRCCLLRHAD